MTFKYSTISLSDVERLMPIENSCHSHPWAIKTFNSCIGGRYFGEYLEDKDDLLGFFVAEYILGEATLMDICVAPQFQGQGHGKQLLGQFLLQAKNLGAEKIWLEVRAKNLSAQMLYINHGFVETGRRTGYYPSAVGFGYEDAIVMCLNV